MKMKKGAWQSKSVRLFAFTVTTASLFLLPFPYSVVEDDEFFLQKRLLFDEVCSLCFQGGDLLGGRNGAEFLDCLEDERRGMVSLVSRDRFSGIFFLARGRG